MILPALVLLATLPVRADQVLEAAAKPSALARETREHLKALIRFDTSNPPGDELPAAKYLKAQLDKDGIPSEILVSTGARASLIARLKGTGEKRALILMCHTDVVPADRKDWATDPFEPVEKEGYLYGRGAVDAKSLCAAELAVMADLKRANVPLARDVVFFAEADEENGGPDRHIVWLLREHGELLDAEFAINEGGNTVWEDGRVTEVRVQAAEKEFMDVTLTARGTAGHAAVPRSDNAIAALARALERLSEHRFPAEVDPVVRGFFETQREAAAPELKAALDAVLAGAPGPELDQAAERVALLSPELGSMLRDTVSPTVLKAGYKSNVIPAEARAVLNARLLPGHDPRELIARLRAAIADLAVEVEGELPSRASVGAMPVDTALFRAAEEAAREKAPGAKVAPFLAAWTTDSQDLRARGVLVYGIEPPLSSADGERVHGRDERIALAALDWYAEYLKTIVLKVAGKPGRSTSRRIP